MESRIDSCKDSTIPRKKEYPEVEIAYSARSSGTKYKYINGIKICSQEGLDLVRLVNKNHITLEQHEIQELCLKKILTGRNTSIPRYLEIHTQDTPIKQYTEKYVKELISYLTLIHTPRK